MTPLTVEKLASEKGYTFAGLVKANDPKSGVKLQKDDRTVTVDQQLVDDIADLAASGKEGS